MRPLRDAHSLRAGRVAHRFPLSLILWVTAIFVFCLWIFIAFNPFQTTNPFVREVTIGESVIGDWRYGGTDPSGNMHFYDSYQQVTVKGDSAQFAADGQFVDITGHTGATLTFEPPMESQTLGPTLLVAAVLFGASGLFAASRVVRRGRPSAKARWRPATGPSFRRRR